MHPCWPVVSLLSVMDAFYQVAGMFFYHVLMSTCLPFTVVALLAEVNSFFLHSRKLLQLYQVLRRQQSISSVDV